jgi:hypothetical protein
MPSKISVANLVMLAGAAVTVLFSFFDFFDRGGNAWDTDFLAFATTVPAILALVMGVWVVLELLGVSLPEDVLTFDRAQLKTTWGIAAAGIMLSWITTDADKGIGYWLMLLGSIAMAVGAVMALLGKGTETLDIPGVGGNAKTGDSTTSATTSATTPPPPPPPPAD